MVESNGEVGQAIKVINVMVHAICRKPFYMSGKVFELQATGHDHCIRLFDGRVHGVTNWRSAVFFITMCVWKNWCRQLARGVQSYFRESTEWRRSLPVTTMERWRWTKT